MSSKVVLLRPDDVWAKEQWCAIDAAAMRATSLTQDERSILKEMCLPLARTRSETAHQRRPLSLRKRSGHAVASRAEGVSEAPK